MGSDLRTDRLIQASGQMFEQRWRSIGTPRQRVKRGISAL
jgi:hypothetical protein